MKKGTKRFLAGSVALLSLVVAGCSQSKSTSESTKETTEVPTTQKEANVEQPESTEVQTSEKVTEAELPNTGTTGVLTTVIVGVCIALSGFGLFAQGRRKES